ncbi:MAG: hypothetical protein H0W61_14500 [Bacteroidetes bacterium]|nr:hypothetical protein [Bacteroidota bacterium]
MKTILSFLLSFNFVITAQTFPYLINPCTVTPTNANANSNVQIITKVYAVYCSLVATDKSQIVNTSAKTIELRACYWQGL